MKSIWRVWLESCVKVIWIFCFLQFIHFELQLTFDGCNWVYSKYMIRYSKVNCRKKFSQCFTIDFQSTNQFRLQFTCTWFAISKVNCKNFCRKSFQFTFSLQFTLVICTWLGPKTAYWTLRIITVGWKLEEILQLCMCKSDI